MTTSSQDLTAAALPPSTNERALRVAVAAYLARFKALSRMHAESDLRAYLAWCADRRLDPLAASGRRSSSMSGGCRKSAG